MLTERPHDNGEGYSVASLETPQKDSLDAAWQRAEAALPEGWVVDGVRRLYDEGHDGRRFVARAVQPIPDEDNPEGNSMALVIGNGPTPAAALNALAEKLERLALIEEARR